MSSKKLGVYLTIFFLLASLAIATLIQDFPADIKVKEWPTENKPCITNRYIFNVTNTENIPRLYNISFKDIDLRWLTINKQLFALLPGKTETIYVLITPSCEIYGNIDAKLNIESNDITAALPIKLNILRDYNYTIAAGEHIKKSNSTEMIFKERQQYEICNAKNISIPVKINNEVDIGNNFWLDVKGEKWATLKNPGIAMYGKQEGIVELILKPTLDTIGNYTFTINAESERGSLKDSKHINVTVKNCFNIALYTPQEEITVCNHNKDAYPITIENNGAFNEEIGLSVDGRCASVFPDTVTIAQKSSKEVQLVFNEDCDVEGRKDITIYAQLKDTPEVKIKSSIAITFKGIEECYESEITGGILHITDQGPRYIQLKNNGIKQIAYEISLSAPDWVLIQPTNLTLEPKSQAQLELVFNPTQDTINQRYKITVKANANNKVMFSRDIIIVLGKETQLDILIYYWRYSIPATLIIIILLIILFIYIRNKRRIYFEKRFEIIGKDEPIEMNINEDTAIETIKFNARKDLAKIKINLERYRKKPVFRKPSNIVYEYFNIGKKNLDENDITGASILFRIKKEWLEKNKLKQNAVVLKRYDKRIWKEYDATRIKSDNMYVYYRCDVLKFGIHAICGIQPETPIKLLPEKKDIKKITPKKEEAHKKISLKPEKTKTVKDASSFLKFLAALIVIYSLVLGIFTGFIYYIAGGIIGIIIIVSIIHLTSKKSQKEDKITGMKIKEAKEKQKDVMPEKSKIKAVKNKEQSKKLVSTKKTDLFGFLLILIIIAAIVVGVIYGYLFYVIAGISGIALLIIILLVIEEKVSKKQEKQDIIIKKEAPKKEAKKVLTKKEKRRHYIIPLIIISIIIIAGIGYYFAPQLIQGAKYLTESIKLPKIIEENITKIQPIKENTTERLEFLRQTLKQSVDGARIEKTDLSQPSAYISLKGLISENLDYIFVIFIIINILIILSNIISCRGAKKLLNKASKAIIDFFLEEDPSKKNK